MDLQKYWRDVRTEMEKLPRQRIYYLVSIDNPDKGVTAGRVMDIADPKMAARRIVDRTHVLATADDIARFEADQVRQADELAAVELNRKGHLAMPKELQDLVRLATGAVKPAPPEPTKKEKEK